MTIIEKADAIMNHAQTYTLASITEEGYPRLCVISRTDSDGIRTVYGSTSLSSEKAKNFRANPKAGVWVRAQEDTIMLTGEVEIRTDRATREAMWQDWFINHYPGGVDDPQYCILKFTAREGMLWIDQEGQAFSADQR